MKICSWIQNRIERAAMGYTLSMLFRVKYLLSPKTLKMFGLTEADLDATLKFKICEWVW